MHDARLNPVECTYRNIMTYLYGNVYRNETPSEDIVDRLKMTRRRILEMPFAGPETALVQAPKRGLGISLLAQEGLPFLGVAYALSLYSITDKTTATENRCHGRYEFHSGVGL